MGCHTWLHTKSKYQPTFEEIKELVVKTFESEIDYLKRHIEGRLDEDKVWLFESQTILQSEWKLEIYKRKLQIINKNLCKVAVCNYYSYYVGTDEFGRSYHYETSNFTLYTGLSGSNKTPVEEWYHDTFRIGGYPEDKLFSLQETLDFIERNEKKIRFGHIACINADEKDYNKRKWKEINRKKSKQKCMEILKEFWTKHPDGLIYFG